MSRVVLLLALGAAFLSSDSAFSEDRFVTINVQNHNPEFKLVPTVVLPSTGDIGVFKEEAGSNLFSYDFKLLQSEWFDVADIILTWNGAYLNPDNSQSNFTQRVELRLRYDFPRAYTVHAYFSNNRTEKEINRLDAITDPLQQWEPFFRSWQIADFYSKSNPLLRLAKRSAARFLFAADVLAERESPPPPYIVVMSEDAILFAQQSNVITPVLQSRIDTARSAFWEDLPHVDTLVQRGNCAVAKSFLSFLQNEKLQHPELYALRNPGASDLLDQKKTMVNSKCPQ